MHRLFLILCFLTIFNVSQSQIKALTENGKEVTLFDDGTWKFSEDSSNTKVDSISTNVNKFSRQRNATFLVKSNTFNIGVYIDPSKWAFSTRKANEKNPEYTFSMKNQEGYALMVTEKTPIDLESMREIALSNAKRASLDAKITSAEYRMVNNKKVLCIKLQGTLQGIKFGYLGYYFTNDNGTTQLLSYTSQQFFGSMEKELEIFLNGLVEISK